MLILNWSFLLAATPCVPLLHLVVSMTFFSLWYPSSDALSAATFFPGVASPQSGVNIFCYPGSMLAKCWYECTICCSILISNPANLVRYQKDDRHQRLAFVTIEILHSKHLESNTLSICQSQQFVVIHDGIHILDPDRIDIAIIENVSPSKVLATWCAWLRTSHIFQP